MINHFTKKKILSFIVASAMTLSLFTPIGAKADVTENSVNNTIKENNNKVINVISFNDFHGSVDCSGKNPGMSKFVYAINEYKKANPNTIVVSGGDNYQGSAMSNLTYGEPVSAMLKQIGIVASAVGNHEFDWGQDHFDKWSKDGNFKFLASNIYDKSTGKPVNFAEPYKIVEKEGVKIGFIGLTTPETEFKTKAENVENLEFKDPKSAAKEWATKLKKEGKADIVIALTHIGTSQDKDGKITGEVVDYDLCNKENGLDAVISAHSHQPVCGEINGIPVVQAYYNGRTLANLTIEVDKNTNKLVSIKPNLDNLYKRLDTLKDDEETLKIYNEYKEKLGPILEEVLAVTDTDLPHDRYSEGTSVLGKWVCDVMKEKAGTQVGITNGGGIRGSLSKGNITMGDLYTIMPFDNTLVKMNVTGEHLKKLIDHGIDNKDVGWVQVSGVKVYYDKNKEEGSRISAMYLDDGTKVEDDKYYSLVTNDFMATNGDNYDFTGAKDVVDTSIPIRDSLVEYLRNLTAQGKHLNYTFEQPLINGEVPNTASTDQHKDNKDNSDNKDDKTAAALQPVKDSNKDDKSSNKSDNKTAKSSEKSSGTIPKTGSFIGQDNIAGIAAVLIISGCIPFVVRKRKKTA